MSENICLAMSVNVLVAMSENVGKLQRKAHNVGKHFSCSVGNCFFDNGGKRVYDFSRNCLKMSENGRICRKTFVLQFR